MSTGERIYVQELTEKIEQLEPEVEELINDCILLSSEIKSLKVSDNELMYPELYKSYIKLEES